MAATRELAGLTEGALNALRAQPAHRRCGPGGPDRPEPNWRPGWYDEHDLLEAVAGAVRARGRGGTDRGAFAAAAFTRRGEAAAGGGERQSVPVNVGITGDTHADRHVLQAHARAGISLDAATVTRPVCSAVISVSDPDEEVRNAIRLVTDWMRAGVRLGRIALLYGTANPYARLLHEHMEAAGLPHQGVPVRGIGDMLLGRTLRSRCRSATAGSVARTCSRW